VTVDDADWLAHRFEQDRPRLRAVAYRMLGSATEADDAVQEAWLHLGRTGARRVENLSGWLTTVVARVCLDMLRSRKARREEPLTVDVHSDADPEREVLLADSVGLALLVVLDTLEPAERLAFVLHDMFAVPFDEIAPVVDRTPAAARQLASRARRRIQATDTVPDLEPGRQRAVVDAFLNAARNGDFDALLAVLDPDVVVRAGSTTVNGAHRVAQQALRFARNARHARPAVVNGAVGIVVASNGRPVTVLAFAIRRGTIVEIDIVTEPARLRKLNIG
jgi:RNA polymerase sigma-70 factor (ECF subfamily)